jgi:hypothetical protein
LTVLSYLANRRALGNILILHYMFVLRSPVPVLLIRIQEGKNDPQRYNKFHFTF